MQHPVNFRTGGEPSCDLQPGALMLREPNRKRPQATYRKENVVRSSADAKELDGVRYHRPALGIRRNRAEHDVGMAADIFGGGLDADIDALIERAVKQRRRPRVVINDQRTTRLRY